MVLLGLYAETKEANLGAGTDPGNIGKGWTVSECSNIHQAYPSVLALLLPLFATSLQRQMQMLKVRTTINYRDMPEESREKECSLTIHLGGRKISGKNVAPGISRGERSRLGPASLHRKRVK